MRFAAGFALGIVVSLIGQAQIEQVERRQLTIICEQHPLDERCMYDQ